MALVPGLVGLTGSFVLPDMALLPLGPSRSRGVLLCVPGCLGRSWRSSHNVVSHSVDVL